MTKETKDILNKAITDVGYWQWWEYWKDYWQKRGTKDAYKEDYACEVTIPYK